VFDEASSPLSDQEALLLPAVLEDDDEAQHNGGSHATFPKLLVPRRKGAERWRRRRKLASCLSTQGAALL
jgi:hypothetical protein